MKKIILILILEIPNIFGAVCKRVNEPKFYIKTDSRIFDACECGDLETVQTVKDCYNKTILSLAFQTAASNGHLNIVKFLAENKISEKYLERALDIACKNGHLNIVVYLLNLFHNHKNLKYYIKALAIKACEHGHSNIIRYLINIHKLDLNFQDENEDGLLHFACKVGNLELIQFLINLDIKINLINKKNMHAFECYPKNKILKLLFGIVDISEHHIYNSYIKSFQNDIKSASPNLFSYAYILFPGIEKIENIAAQIWTIKNLTKEMLLSRMVNKLNILTNLSIIFSAKEITEIIIENIKNPKCPEKFIIELVHMALSEYSIYDLVDDHGLTLLNYALANSRDELTKLINSDMQKLDLLLKQKRLIDRSK